MSAESGRMLSHYRLTEKLGQGGMGVVFKALDTRLNRTVAVKILPPELMSDRERRLRFQREAQAAAALNHPNIAVIHEVGEEEGTDFIVMEYVEGRTLRACLRERSLSLKEWLRIGAALAEAVTHAHRQGVVHRDLKPDNVMITPDGLVKILDFGLAKLTEPPDAARAAARALHDDLETISHELTLSGKVLGTIPYMSPEQVQGESVDHRSDLFSLGVVLYEMASRRSPFHATSEVETLHAILTVEPPPLSEFLPDLPAEADRIVRKAMEKERDRRYQDAADLATDLRNLKRDLDTGRTAIASRTAVTGVGSAGAAAPARPRWRRATVIAPVAVVLLVALAAGAWFFWLRPGAGLTGTGIPGGAGPEASLAVMYFENVPDPEDRDRLGQMITSLLITDLSESRHLRVVSRQRLYDILRLLRREDVKVIDPSIASEVARKAGVRWILTGSVLQTTPSLVLTADVSEARSGQVLASQRVTTQPGESIFAAVDQLSAEIKRDLLPPEATAAEAPRPVAQVTTSSPEAYRAYLDGMDDLYKASFPEARVHFARAAELDSTFAMAHYMLAYLAPDGSEEQVREVALAGRYSERATDQEKAFIRSLQAEVAGKTEDAIREVEDVARRYPDSKPAYMILAGLYTRKQNPAGMIRASTRIIEIDPLDKMAYNLLAYGYEAAGQFEKSIEAINKYISLVPDEANPYDTRGDLYGMHGQWAEAAASYREALRKNPNFHASREKLGYLLLEERDYAGAEGCFRAVASSDDASTRADGRSLLALVPVFRGRLQEALEVLSQGMASDALENQGLSQLTKLGVVVDIRLEQGDVAGARAAADTFAAIAAKAEAGGPFRGRDVQAGVLIRAGDFGRAERLLLEARKDINPQDANRLQTQRLLQARLAVARGDTAQALEGLRQLTAAPIPSTRFWFWTGCAYLDVGHIEEAVNGLERALASWDPERVELGLHVIKAHYLLGTAYERSGWNLKAAEQYRQFLAYWESGDPGLPGVKEARERLARLESRS